MRTAAEHEVRQDDGGRARQDERADRGVEHEHRGQQPDEQQQHFPDASCRLHSYVDQSSECDGRRRSRLRCPCRFFCWMRASTDERFGRVATRGRSMCSAASILRRRRSRASSRFWAWERRSEAVGTRDRPDLLEQPRPLARAERGRVLDVEAQLDPRVRRVGVLTARTAGAGEAPFQLVLRNDTCPADVQVRHA